MSKYTDQAKALHKTMSSHLRTLRKDLGFTMRSLSTNLGTPHSFIGKVENQDRRLDIAEFVLYCDGKDKDPRAVFDEMLSSAGR